MADQGMRLGRQAPERCGLWGQLAEDIDLAFAGELSGLAIVWLRPLAAVGGPEADVEVGGTLFTGRQVAKALLAELPLPKDEQQEAACRRLMELVRSGAIHTTPPEAETLAAKSPNSEGGE